MNVRTADQRDLADAATIECHCLSPWSTAQIAAEFAQPLGLQLVVEENGVPGVIGWCCARHVGWEAELLKISILPGHKRRGAAGKLLDRLEQLLIQGGVRELFLEVRSQNKPALGLYRKHGFHVAGVRPGYYHNPEDTGLIFRKELLSCSG